MIFNNFKILSLIVLLPFFVIAQKSTKDTPDTVLLYAVKQSIADRYGIKNFAKVKSLEFTFNVKFKDITKTRKWLWDVKNNMVTYWGPDKNGKRIEYTYNYKNVNKNDDKEKTIDSRFINDHYWLLFPFHLVWDKKTGITYKKDVMAPISKKKTYRMIVTYPKQAGGYTPGDIYELYIGKNNLINEWVYRPGGSTKTKFPITWEKYKNFNGLIISTEHNDKSRDFKLWFSDVSVVLEN